MEVKLDAEELADVDGEMRADIDVVEDILNDTYSFSEFDDPANVLIFPNLGSGNIGYKLLRASAARRPSARCSSAWAGWFTSSSRATR